MSARRLTLTAGALAALALAGCGGGGGSTSSTSPSGASSSAGGGQKLSLRAGPGSKLSFDRKALRAKAGRVTIVMSNPSQLSHNVAIEGGGVNAAVEVVGPGGASTVSANLKPGTYTFFCTVPGHREAGMQGTLTLK